MLKRYRNYSKSPVKRPIDTSAIIAKHEIKQTIEELDEINLGGSMSIWHIQLESGYDEVIFAESYSDALQKAEYNEKIPLKNLMDLKCFIH